VRPLSFLKIQTRGLCLRDKLCRNRNEVAVRGGSRAEAMTLPSD